VRIILVPLLWLFMGTTSAHAEREPESIKLGVLLPLSGDSAPGQGQYARQGVELAHSEDKNSAIQLIFEDSQCQGKAVVSAAQKLVSFDKVSMIIGDVCWTHLIAPITGKNQVVVIAPGSAQSSVREAGDYVFRLKLDVSVDSREFARIMRSQLDTKKVVVFYVNDEWGEGISNNFSEEFTTHGGKILSKQGFLQSERDFKSFLLRAKRLKPDLIMIGAFPAQVALIARQARNLSINIPLAAYGGSVDAETLQLGGDALDGLLVLQEYVVDPANPAMLSFDSRFKQRYGKDPNLFAALGYDAYQLLLNAVRNCQTNTSCIRDSLYSTVNYAGASGLISFDDKGDVRKESKLRMVKNSQFVDYKR